MSWEVEEEEQLVKRGTIDLSLPIEIRPLLKGASKRKKDCRPMESSHTKKREDLATIPIHVALYSQEGELSVVRMEEQKGLGSGSWEYSFRVIH